jgi:hypothetical protein
VSSLGGAGLPNNPAAHAKLSVTSVHVVLLRLKSRRAVVNRQALREPRPTKVPRSSLPPTKQSPLAPLSALLPHSVVRRSKIRLQQEPPETALRGSRSLDKSKTRPRPNPEYR